MATERASAAAPAGTKGLTVGELVSGRFEICGPGTPTSFGVRYPAADRESGASVALEIFPRTVFPHPRQVDSLRRAVRRFAKRTHRSLRTVYAMGLTEGDAPFVVVEAMDGLHLAGILSDPSRPRPYLSLRGAYNVVAHLAAALEAGHPSRVHGALRPHCVQVSSRGRVKLGDLGTAYAMLRVAGVEGFPADEQLYLAPELFEEDGRPTPATDVHGLAAVLYAMLTGAPPRPHPPSPEAAPVRVAAPSRLRPELAPALDELVLSGLAPDPRDRPSSPERLRRALMALVATAPETPAKDDFGVDIDVDLEPFAALPTVPVPTPPLPEDAQGRVPGLGRDPDFSGATLSPPAPLVPIDWEPDESTEILIPETDDTGPPPAPRVGPAAGASEPASPVSPPPPPASGPPAPPDLAGAAPVLRPRPPELPVTDVNLAAALDRISARDAHRWMVVKDGLDHGPFSGRELLDLIAKGEVRGSHSLLDTDTGARLKVQDHEDFSLFAAQYDLKHKAQREREKLDQAEKRRRTLGLAQILVAGAVVLVLVGGGIAFLFSRNAAEERTRNDAELAGLYEAGEVEIVGSAGILPEPKRRRGGSGGRGGGGGKRSGASAGGGFGSYEEAMNQAVELGDVTKGGGEARLSSGTVAGVMNRNINRLFGCVGQELRRGGSLSQVTIDLAIAGNGRVLGASVRPGSGAFQSCITSKVRGIRFPTFSAPRMGARYSFAVD
jgi:serine/threonine protein kinase